MEVYVVLCSETRKPIGVYAQFGNAIAEVHKLLAEWDVQWNHDDQHLWSYGCHRKWIETYTIPRTNNEVYIVLSDEEGDRPIGVYPRLADAEVSVKTVLGAWNVPYNPSNNYSWRCGPCRMWIEKYNVHDIPATTKKASHN